MEYSQGTRLSEDILVLNVCVSVSLSVLLSARLCVCSALSVRLFVCSVRSVRLCVCSARSVRLCVCSARSVRLSVCSARSVRLSIKDFTSGFTTSPKSTTKLSDVFFLESVKQILKVLISHLGFVSKISEDISCNFEMCFLMSESEPDFNFCSPNLRFRFALSKILFCFSNKEDK